MLTAIEIALVVIAAVLVIGAARIAQPVLVPVITGILISYALRPLVSMLVRARVPRPVGAVLIIGALVSLVSGSLYVARDDLNDAVASFPSAARKLRSIAAEAARGAPGPVGNMKAAAVELDRAAAEATGKTPASEPPTASATAKVQAFLAEQSGQALAVIVELGVALLLALLLLAAGDTFRRKVTKLAGASLARRRVTVEMLDEIDRNIQTYMITTLLANVLIALCTWGGLYLLRVPNAGIWGVATGVLHIIPYAGTLVAATGVGIATLADSGDVGHAAIAMAIVFGAAEAIGFGLASWFQGRAASMNTVAVFIGLLFFGWLWGGWGLLLGMPILATFKCIADRVEGMSHVRELLGR